MVEEDGQRLREGKRTANDDQEKESRKEALCWRSWTGGPTANGQRRVVNPVVGVCRLLVND